MAKSPNSAGGAIKARKATSGAKALGRTSDGVVILKPKGRATHFTQKELRDAVAKVVAARSR